MLRATAARSGREPIGDEFVADEAHAAAVGAARRLGRLDAGDVAIRCRCHGRDEQESPAHGQPLVTLPVGQQAVVPDLDEALRQDVLHEATQELLGRQRHRLGAMVVGVVLVAEGHPAVVELHQPVIADGHAMRVAGQVLQHLLRSAERRLGVDHPVLGVQRRQPGREARRRSGAAVPATRARPLVEARARSPARNLPRNTRLSTRTGRKKPGRHATQRGDASTSPLRIARQAAAGDDAVHVRMMVQVLAPGVQHHQHADRRAQPLRVGGHLAQRRRGRLQQQVVQRRPGWPAPARQFRRQREDDMVVLDRQQVLGLALEPAGAGQGLALGTVAVAARVVGDAFVAAVEAALDVAAQRRRAADRQVAQRLALRRESAGRRAAPGRPRRARRITSATSSAGRSVPTAAVMAGPPPVGRAAPAGRAGWASAAAGAC